jgi:hypothetical protein
MIARRAEAVVIAETIVSARAGLLMILSAKLTGFCNQRALRFTIHPSRQIYCPV